MRARLWLTFLFVAACDGESTDPPSDSDSDPHTDTGTNPCEGIAPVITGTVSGAPGTHVVITGQRLGGMSALVQFPSANYFTPGVTNSGDDSSIDVTVPSAAISGNGAVNNTTNSCSTPFAYVAE